MTWPSGLPPLPRATPRDRPVALLLRHAERPPLGQGEVGDELSLTSAGRASALALGQAFGTCLLRLHTSPIRRCRETAAALRGSAELPIIDDRLLGDPGVFVRDGALAWDNWVRLGHQGVMDHLSDQDTPLPGMAAPEAAIRRLISHLADHLAGGPGLHVFVTHDALIVPTVARLLRPPGPCSPDFLECAALWRTTSKGSGVLHLAYRHSTCALPC